MRFVVVVVALALAGCVTDQEQHNAAMTAAVTACHESLKLPVDRAKCINTAEIRVFPNEPFPDLRSLRQAYRVDLATKVQSGEMTPEQARLAYARMTAEIISEAERRQAQRTTAAAAVYSATRPSSPITCNTVSTLTTCY